MENLKVSEFQRKKYGFFFWIRERFYERSLGHALREGQLPASVLDNELLLKDGNALTRLLPYESYDDGCFLNQDTAGLVYQVDNRMDANDLSDVMHALADSGLMTQLVSVLSGAGDHLLLAVSAEHAQVEKLKAEVRTHLDAYLTLLSTVDPQQFIDILRPFFQDASGVSSNAYDDHMLINTQFGDAEGSVDFERMVLGSKDIRFYTVSRWSHGGWPIVTQIPKVMPPGYVVVMSHNLVRIDDSKKYLTSTSVVSSVPHQHQDKGVSPFGMLNDGKCPGHFELEKLFASQNWILEREIAYQPLILMNTLPLGVTMPAQKVLLKRRYVTELHDHLKTALDLRCV